MLPVMVSMILWSTLMLLMLLMKQLFRRQKYISCSPPKTSGHAPYHERKNKRDQTQTALTCCLYTRKSRSKIRSRTPFPKKNIPTTFHHGWATQSPSRGHQVPPRGYFLVDNTLHWLITTNSYPDIPKVFLQDIPQLTPRGAPCRISSTT